MSKKLVILLTACVSPDGMFFTNLQDEETRKLQYITALEFYLQNTAIPIVFCENSGCDISAQFQSYIAAGRLEYHTFSGNDYDKSLGKGYGEAQIILYAFQKSAFLRSAKLVVKITGRIIIRNIQDILHSRWLLLKHVFRCSFQYNDYIYSQCFVIDKESLLDILNCGAKRINDSENVFFEHVLYQEVAKRKHLFVIPFFCPLVCKGICGTTGLPYPQPTFSENLLVNSLYTALLYMQRAQYLRCFIFGLAFKIMKCITRS